MSNDGLKVPSQVFRWFEKMKANYERSVQATLRQFEQFTAQQQARVDKSNQENIDNLKQSHQRELEQNQQVINDLKADIQYYKQQISQQQQSIEQLNTRYDAVMNCLLTEKQKDLDIKDIFADDSTEFASKLVQADTDIFIDSNQALKEDAGKNPVEKATLDSQQEIAQHSLETQNPTSCEQAIDPDSDERLFEQAISARQSGDDEQAFVLFEQAANSGNIKAMGAMGRAYFLAEGTKENPALGLAWLVCAANHGLPQAIDRVQHFHDTDHELYLQGLELVDGLFPARIKKAAIS